MSYSYDKFKPNILTDEGQRLFLKIRDDTHRLLKEAGVRPVREVPRTFVVQAFLPSGTAFKATSYTLEAALDTVRQCLRLGCSDIRVVQT